MINNRHFCVFDFETGGKDPQTCEILQIGSTIVNKNNLTTVDEFASLVQPRNFDALEDKALEVNGLTREQLREAPLPEVIFPAWAKWIQQHNTKADKSSWGAPIPTGWGIDNFDIPIFNRYCKEFGHWDEKWNSRTLMNPVFTFDVMKSIWLIGNNLPGLKNVKLVTVLEYMGMSTEEIEKGAHDASWDTKWTANVAIRYLKFMKHITSYNSASGKRRLELKDCLKGNV